MSPPHSPLPCSLRGRSRCRGELPPLHRMAPQPPTSQTSPDLQVIQGQAGARLVHGMVGDGDACRMAREETGKRESWLRTEDLAPSLPDSGSAREGRFPAAAWQEQSCPKQLSTSRPSPPSPAPDHPRTLQVQVSAGSTWGGSAPGQSWPHADLTVKVCDLLPLSWAIACWVRGSTWHWSDCALKLFLMCFCP